MSLPAINNANGEEEDSDNEFRRFNTTELRQALSEDGEGKRNEDRDSEEREDVGGWEVRHGWEEQGREEYLGWLNNSFYIYYTDKRHETEGLPRDNEHLRPAEEWRMRDRLKTVSAALALCLNIGVDPPDVIKTNPTAKLECWIDPTIPTTFNSKTMEMIGKKLQEQYESLSIRTRYKQYLDPSVEETRKFCQSQRRNAKDERVMFHYNGHGVPLPTDSGEIWVFNKNYTQYIPISLFDLQSWLGAPSLYVFDASHAGQILANFPRFIQKHEAENEAQKKKNPDAQLQFYGDNTLLAACDRKEELPTNPDLPADMFTCCLTTPVEISLRHHVLQNPLTISVTLKELSRMPGKLQERRSPLGELNWIFTAITDTIAWSSFDGDMFKKLFRQDLMVAALFRNFLLAKRILRIYECHPQSIPRLPDTHNHPLWQSWDTAVDLSIRQLPAIIEADENGEPYEYLHSDFFTNQLTAFEKNLAGGASPEKPPEQLPIVLQVLLSQVHRLRALILLSRFLDLGPWAVDMALRIGIFPYVLKLLQSAAPELKPVMIFIWARILAVDPRCQVDLIKDSGFQYFVNLLNPAFVLPVSNNSEHRAMCAFIVAMICRGYSQGQNVCLNAELYNSCVTHLRDPDNPLLRQWSCLCLGMLWNKHPEAKLEAIQLKAHLHVCEMARDPVPEVRAAALHALTMFIYIAEEAPAVDEIIFEVVWRVSAMRHDGNVMVRRELLALFSKLVTRYPAKFPVAAIDHLAHEIDLLRDSVMHGRHDNPNHALAAKYYVEQEDLVKGDPLRRFRSDTTMVGAVWLFLQILTSDPHPGLAQHAQAIIDHVYQKGLSTPTVGRILITNKGKVESLIRMRDANLPKVASPYPAPTHVPTTPPVLSKNESYLSIGIRKVVGAFNQKSESASAPQGSAASDGNQPRQLRGPPRAHMPNEWVRPPNEHDQASVGTTLPKRKAPKPRRYKLHDPHNPPTLPVKSHFFEWALEYFAEPQMKPGEHDEPGSSDYNLRLWRRNRNEKILESTQPLKTVAAREKWDVPKGMLQAQSAPMKITFHQFEDHLVATDDKDSVLIWDFEKHQLLSHFSNGNPPCSRIEEARFINEDDAALLITGASDGTIRIFRNYDDTADVELVGGFRALWNLESEATGGRLVFDWQQGQGKLIVAGDKKVFNIWNSAAEIYSATFRSRTTFPCTSLTSDAVAGNIFVAGFADGAVRAYDMRCSDRSAMFKSWHQCKQWITDVHLQRGGNRELICGSRNGEVRFWDLRMPQSLRLINTLQESPLNSTLRTLSLHEHAPVFATGTSAHEISIYSLGGRKINTLEPYNTLGTSNPDSAARAAAFHQVPESKAYSKPEDMAADKDVDMVVVSVKVNLHHRLTMPALKAKKDVFVEWPLGNDLSEAEELASLARKQGVKTSVGLQARFQPSMVKVKEIVDSGALGRIVSTTVFGADNLLDAMPARLKYFNNPDVDPILHILGELSSLNATTSIANPNVTFLSPDGTLSDPVPRNDPDNVIIQGTLISGATLKFQFVMPPSSTPSTFSWLIYGEKGALKVENKSCAVQMMEAKVFETELPDSSAASAKALHEVFNRTGPQWKEVDVEKKELNKFFGGIGAAYEAFVNNPEELVTFDDAVLRHRMVKVIKKSAKEGTRESYF
ncbi:MAG: hypothetical protein LQ342_003654 [Letrouitia transgressa]|nr:MAG: hypothetical protein LQ342_003654 [Letrouitia transgressa]